MAETAATGREIIQEIVRNMREGLEPLHSSALAPGIFHVYLHVEDYERLRGILPRLEIEARTALDESLAELRRAPLAARLGLGRKPLRYEGPEDGWRVEFHENTDDDARPGDILVHSELALPERPEYGAGNMTKRIRTGRMAGQETVRHDYEPRPGSDVLAVLEFEDNQGRHTFQMTKNQIVIGRGGRDYWTDLKLVSAPDVSREHARLRRDPQTGEFFLKDVSSLGTTVNGRRIPSSIEVIDGEKRDKNVEVKLPPQARIGLADVVYLDFRAAGK